MDTTISGRMHCISTNTKCGWMREDLVCAAVTGDLAQLCGRRFIATVVSVQ